MRKAKAHKPPPLPLSGPCLHPPSQFRQVKVWMLVFEECDFDGDQRHEMGHAILKVMVPFLWLQLGKLSSVMRSSLGLTVVFCAFERKAEKGDVSLCEPITADPNLVLSKSRSFYH